MTPDGTVAVGHGRTTETSTLAVRWSEATGMVSLGTLGGYSQASDVSDDGRTIVGNSTNLSPTSILNEAFIWTEATGMVGLGALPMPGTGKQNSNAFGISGDGSIVVGASESVNGREAVQWNADDGIVALGDLPGGKFAASALDISADGRWIVGRGSTEIGYEAFIWDETYGMRSVADMIVDDWGVTDLDGWTLNSAYAISDDGWLWYQP